MKSRTMVAGVMALAVTVGGGAFIANHVNAASTAPSTAAKSTYKEFAGKGGFGHSRFEAAVLTKAEIAKLLGLTADQLSTQLKAGKSLSAIAGEKNVQVQSVIDLEVKAITSALDQQLKDGKITQAQYDSSKSSITTWATEVVNRTFVGKGGKAGGRGHGEHGGAAVLDDAALAKLLGMTTAELKTAVQSGKSLATIAGETKVTVKAVTDQVTATLTAALDKQLADKVISQAKYDERKTEMAAQVPNIVNGTFAGKEGRGGFGHHGGAALLDDAALAKLLGMTTAELKTAVQSGKSLATIAGEKKVTVKAVTDQVTSTLTAALDKQLADKVITQAKYDEEKAELATEVTNIVNGKFRGKGEGRGHGGHGHRG